MISLAVQACLRLWQFRYADQISTGDELLVEKHGKLIPASVTSINSSAMQGSPDKWTFYEMTVIFLHSSIPKDILYYTNFFPGAYVPLTVAGNIVVDGVLASCHSSADHDLANIAITPFNWFPQLVEWIFWHGQWNPSLHSSFRACR